MKTLKQFIGLAVLVVLATASLWWAILQWHECREMGHSVLYCVAHIT